MEDNLIEILSSFGYPVYRQGSMSDDAVYPPTFITFWNFDSPDHSYYDDLTWIWVALAVITFRVKFLQWHLVLI